MTAAQVAYMLVGLGYPDDSVTETLAKSYSTPTDEAEQLVREAHIERSSRLADQDAAIEVEREAARRGEWDTATRGG